jgi:uncharacterized protein YndB with AHSA1/START domain
MSMPTADTSVRTSVTVEAPIERAFHVYTAEMGTWWPEGHHLLEGELAEMVFEPRVGGRVYDRGTDGSECQWATVLAYDPPEHVAFSWNISPQWELEPDPERASEVHVTFVAEAQDRTRVELEHRHLDRHGEGWEGMAAAVGSPDGWGQNLRGFAEAAGR